MHLDTAKNVHLLILESTCKCPRIIIGINKALLSHNFHNHGKVYFFLGEKKDSKGKLTF